MFVSRYHILPPSYPLASQQVRFGLIRGNEILPGMGGIAPPAGFGGFAENRAAALPAPAVAPVPNMEMAGASVAAHVSPHIFHHFSLEETGSKAPSPPENQVPYSGFVLQLVASQRL